MKRYLGNDPDLFAKLASELAISTRDGDIARQVNEIVTAVRDNGDSALIALTERFDGAILNSEELRLSPDALSVAVADLTATDRAAIEEAIANVEQFHDNGRPNDWTTINSHGGEVGERYYPLRRVGIYVPGGQVPLVSTVVMTLTLAKTAGVSEIAVATPPRADGSIDSILLAAISLCGGSEVYPIGGAQAIAALAHGTETVSSVDKIFGPGNAYVNEAKRQLFGIVGIDLLPGPSEVMVVCDESAQPTCIAAALLAQAEHGSGKEKVFLISESESLIDQSLTEITRQLKTLARRDAAQSALQSGFYVIHADSEERIVEVANFVAPEHLELQVDDEKIERLTKAIKSAGAILQGHYSPTVLGDFAAGPSHVLPTARSSRFSSGLRLNDFLRRSSIVRYDRDALEKAAPVISSFSKMENLDAHGRSLTIRLEKPEA